MKTYSINNWICPECSASNFTLDSFISREDEVIEGRINCKDCGTWYRIEEGIVDLLPVKLRRPELYIPFCEKHLLFYDDDISDSDSKSPDPLELKQISHFRDEVINYEKTIVELPYSKAIDQVALIRWMKACLSTGQHLLDIGCGSGRSSIPFARHGLKVTGLDISEEMLRAMRLKILAMGLGNNIELVVGDAMLPPVKDRLFDACVIYGALHHFPEPESVIKNASAKIIPGGHFFFVEPHRSPVRFLYNALIKFWQLYAEEARQDPLFSEEEASAWLAAAGIKAKLRLSSYFPPHFFNFTPLNFNIKMLDSTDKFFSSLPGIRKLAGAIICEGEKI